MAVFDATALLHFLEPNAPAPRDPGTNTPVADAKQRIDYLIEALEQKQETISIPTPVLSEVLVHAGDAGPQYLEILDSSRWFRIVPFDHRAAVELAAMTREAIASGDLRAGTDTTRAKLKFDRQIIAIARVEGQATVYSDDEDIKKLGAPLGLTVIAVYELPQPPGAAQGTLNPCWHFARFSVRYSIDLPRYFVVADLNMAPHFVGVCQFVRRILVRWMAGFTPATEEM